MPNLINKLLLLTNEGKDFISVMSFCQIDALSREAELVKGRKVWPERENGRFGGSQTQLLHKFVDDHELRLCYIMNRFHVVQILS